ncbi:MAG: hypothetical protein ASARMPREDX12_004244 [Alectoria sarmentosa]|nr:MAG: hypothetical protein ASARMPREDX12_004244 [Alectoria sarmentosa]
MRTAKNPLRLNSPTGVDEPARRLRHSKDCEKEKDGCSFPQMAIPDKAHTIFKPVSRDETDTIKRAFEADEEASDNFTGVFGGPNGRDAIIEDSRTHAGDAASAEDPRVIHGSSLDVETNQ